MLEFLCGAGRLKSRGSCGRMAEGGLGCRDVASWSQLEWLFRNGTVKDGGESGVNKMCGRIGAGGYRNEKSGLYIQKNFY